jgi:hypothetical protein
VGLVTSALWNDVDGDGSVDLLVACEWGAIHLFQNRNGALKDVTEPPDSRRSTAGGTLSPQVISNRDGDIDFVALNAGLKH